MMKLKYWAIIILATLAVCAGVFYYLKQPAPDLGPITVHHLSHIQPQIDASNWQIIRNDQPGYQLKLPPGWKLNHASSLPDFFAVYQSVPDAAWAEGVGVPDDGLWMEVSYSGASCESPDTDFVNEQDVANITDKNVCRGLFGVDVGFWNSDPNKVVDEIFLNAILDTFQPTASQTPTATSSSAENNATSSPAGMSGWETYASDIYGFEIKYPPTLKVAVDSFDPSAVSLIPLEQTSDETTSPNFSTVTIRVGNNFQDSSLADLWKTSDAAQVPCYSDPKSESVAGYLAMESLSDAKCVEFPDSPTPQARFILLEYKDRSISFDIINQPLADQIMTTLNFTNATNKIATTGVISYDDNEKLFTVTQKQFKVLDVFTAAYLENYSSGCFGPTHSLNYYKALLSKFSTSDLGAYYDFNFLGPQQEFGNSYEITVIPNKFGYKIMDDFNTDFGLCDAGEPFYPSQLSSDYLMFEPACGTGASETGCDAVENFVGDSIKLNQ